jgi:hypothetical protein
MRRWTEGETREGSTEKNKTKFYRWVPVVDAHGEDVTSEARGKEGCPYEAVDEARAFTTPRPADGEAREEAME